MSDQNAFIAALQAADLAAPDAVCAPDGGSPGVRFDVYRNNVMVSLTDALKVGFPVIDKLVGQEFFSAMAREFIRAHPPSSPLLTFYGTHFANWLRSFPPVAAWPYLSEVAQLEQARREAYHAKDAPPLDPQALGGLSPDALGALHLTPHPSVQILRTQYPALAIWARNVGFDALAQAAAGEVLICRPAWEVMMSPAPGGTAETLAALAAGMPLSRALPSRADTAAIFACLFSAGALCDQET